MTDEPFTEPDDDREEWVDVRMTDPDEGEWDVDVVVVEGRVEYVDLRVRPELLGDFVECLIDDVGQKRAEEIIGRFDDDEES
ncbi:MAG: hypothetical protein ABEH64_07850 [Salinirussus sp.]